MYKHKLWRKTLLGTPNMRRRTKAKWKTHIPKTKMRLWRWNPRDAVCDQCTYILYSHQLPYTYTSLSEPETRNDFILAKRSSKVHLCGLSGVAECIAIYWLRCSTMRLRWFSSSFYMHSHEPPPHREHTPGTPGKWPRRRSCTFQYAIVLLYMWCAFPFKTPTLFERAALADLLIRCAARAAPQSSDHRVQTAVKPKGG